MPEAYGLPDTLVRRRLGQIGAAPNVIIWGAHGLEGVELDDLQRQQLTGLSTGKTVETVARMHGATVRTEQRRLHELYSLLGAWTAPPAIITAIVWEY